MGESAHKIVIKGENISKTFSKWSQSRALNGVSLEIKSGEFVILFGPSGCGKSTLLNILYGLETPTSGRVLIRDKDVSRFSAKELNDLHRKKIGLVFQQFSFLKSLTVLENVFFPRMLVGASRRLRRQRGLHLLEMLEIAEFADRYPQELSGGQQQRVALARSLVNNPWIMFFDEPTGSLDKKSGDEIMKLISNLNMNSHRTIVLVTHNTYYVPYAHRVLYMEDGKIVREVVNRELDPWKHGAKSDHIDHYYPIDLDFPTSHH